MDEPQRATGNNRISQQQPRNWEHDYARLRWLVRSSESEGVPDFGNEGPPSPDSPIFYDAAAGRTRIINQQGRAPGGRFGNSWSITVENDEVQGGTDYADRRLLEDLRAACEALGADVQISDALRHRHEQVPGGSRKSRHFSGRALDINIVNGRRLAEVRGPGHVLSDWLVDNRGYLKNPPRGESGNSKVILYDNGDGIHHTHIHMSVR